MATVFFASFAVRFRPAPIFITGKRHSTTLAILELFIHFYTPVLCFGHIADPDMSMASTGSVTTQNARSLRRRFSPSGTGLAVRRKQVLRVCNRLGVTGFAKHGVQRCCRQSSGKVVFQVFRDVISPLIHCKCYGFIKGARDTNRPIHVRWFRTDLHFDYVPVGRWVY